MRRETTIRLIYASVLCAFGVLLPIVFHALGISGSIFLPMHIPVLLCGLICGYKFGALSGILVPLLSSVLTGMPPIYPVAVYMAAELVAYGVIAGWMAKKNNIFVTLIVTMIGGRIVLGIAQMLLLGFGESGFALKAFLTSAFVTALPGIVLQVIFFPIIMYALKKSNLLPNNYERIRK